MNPSLEVASMFGIRPNRLPGVVLFTLSDDRQGVSDGVYLPLKTEFFESDLSRVEEVFADLFSLIQECRENARSPAEHFANLRKKVASLRRSQRFRPVKEYLKGSLSSLVSFPGMLVESMSKAFVQETARRLTEG